LALQPVRDDDTSLETQGADTLTELIAQAAALGKLLQQAAELPDPIDKVASRPWAVPRDQIIDRI
jgi:hypothetical protein